MNATSTSVPSMQIPDNYPGTNVLLLGPPGTGKTHALSTYADSGLELFVIFLEPGLESLKAAWVDKNLPIPPNVHWHYLEPRTRSFADMQTMADKVGRLDLKALANYKDIVRGQYNRFEALYGVLNNFTCQRTGASFGSVEKWTNQRVIAIDGLTGIGDAAMEMMTGDKPVRDKPDYGIAQTNIMNLIHKLTTGCPCHFALVAHPDRQIDEVLGGVKLMPGTPGKAIQGIISQPFSDVILTKREIASWWWDTADSSADLKTRNLPILSKIPPNFGTIINKWRSRALAQ